MSAASFIHKSTLYVPLEDFCLLLGLVYNKTSDTLSFSSTTTPLFSTNYSLVAFQKKHLDSVRYRFSTKLLSASLIYKGKNTPLSNLLSLKNNNVYINSLNILKSLGYTINLTETALTLTYKEFLYSIPINSRVWTGQNK